MAEVKKQTAEIVDPWKTPKETWQFVTLPEEDPLGTKFPQISLNKTIFQPGETYQVPPAVAAYVNERIKAFNRSCVRLLQPNVDRLAQQQVAAGTSGPVAVSYIDATQIKTV